MKQWLKLRYDLYQQMRQRAESWTGLPQGSFRRYQKVFEKNLERPWKGSTREDLLDAINERKIIYLGDFHALLQSQKFHLRILQSLSGKRPRVLAVEFFEARHQKWVDLFWAHAISEKDFLKKIQWEKNWGFPWENFKPLFVWAQKNKVPVLALNQMAKASSNQSLKIRDQKAAGILAQYCRKNPSTQVFVVFGEMHLAEEHLPKQLTQKLGLKKKDWLCIFLNSEKIYFELLKRHLENDIEVVRLKENQFCVLNTPPWVKWQNYLMDLENRADQGFDEDEVELSDEVARVLEILTHEFAVVVPKDSFSIYSGRTEHFLDLLKDSTSKEEFEYFKALIQQNASFYLPRIKTGYLAEASTNHVAALAMAILYFQVSKAEKYPFRFPKDFLGLIWLEAMIYLGSKVINPKRKTNTLSDLKKSLQNPNQYIFEKEALQLALQQKMNEILPQPLPLMRRLQKKSTHREAARILGGMLGEKIAFAWAQRMISKENLKALIVKRVDLESFQDVYYENLSVIESWPEPFSSKKERL